MGRSKQKKTRHRAGGRAPRWLPVVCAALAAAVLLAWAQPWRRTVALPEELTATSVLVLDGSGRVLAQREAEQPRSPSSLTKLLSLYLILEDVEAGTLTLEQRVQVPPAAAATTGSKYGLFPGQEVTVEQLLAGAILNSGCDCVLTLAYLSAGSEEAFVERMNQTAEELGLTGSHFVNATGLDAAGHYMTARDLGVLARRLVEDYPLYLDYSSQASLELDGLTFRNLNRLAGADARVLGLKTGTSPIGGNNLVTYARQGEERCYIVLLDSASETLRFSETEQLLDLVLGGEG